MIAPALSQGAPIKNQSPLKSSKLCNGAPSYSKIAFRCSKVPRLMICWILGDVEYLSACFSRPVKHSRNRAQRILSRLLNGVFARPSRAPDLAVLSAARKWGQAVARAPEFTPLNSQLPDATAASMSAPAPSQGAPIKNQSTLKSSKLRNDTPTYSKMQFCCSKVPRLMICWILGGAEYLSARFSRP